MCEIVIILLSSAVVLAGVLYLAMDNAKYRRLIRLSFALSIIGGLVLYGYCHSRNTGGATAVVRTLLDVGGMFAGNSNEEIMQGLPRMEGSIMQFLFWLFHFLAYYTIAGAVLNILGGDLLRRIRYFLLRTRNVNLIYGIYPDTLAIARELSESKCKDTLAFVSREESALEKAAQKFGEVFYDGSAVKEAENDAVDGAGTDIVKQLHLRPGKRKICLYALSQNYDENLNYALFLRRCLKNAGIRSEQTALVMLGCESRDGQRLQALGDRYGYGSVRVADEAELSARVLIQKHPICDVISFDEQTAHAKEDVHFLLIGFNEKGRAILRKAVANGQFEGSSFHAAVFDPDIEHISGMFQKQYHAMLEEYDIQFYPSGGRSLELCEFLDRNAAKLNYIVLAIDDARESREIAMDISDYLEQRRAFLDISDDPEQRKQNIYVCNADGVFAYLTGERGVKRWNPHGSEFILSGEMDRLAMRINDYYIRKEKTVDLEKEKENWKKCTYFDRMSSRASGDYLQPLLEKVLPDLLRRPFTEAELDRELAKPEIAKKMENLSRSEHLRWCAFSYSMGWSLMPKSDFQANVENYKQQREKGIPPKERIRISKDAKCKTHACLIPWEKLDDLSAVENAVTGGNVNYRLNDKLNIQAMVNCLRQQETRQEA